MTILLVGGDLRQVYLANRYAKEHTVLVYGLDQADALSKEVIILKALKESVLFPSIDLLLLPIPMMENEQFLNTPLTKESIALSDVLDCIPLHTKILAGKISKPIQAVWKAECRRFIDLLEREELAVMNAVPTAEGTLQIMLEELATTLYGLDVLIIGAGRISKVLRRDLVALGAHVTVAARKSADLAWAEMDGCKTTRVASFETASMDYDCIINTVPAMVLDKAVLKKVPGDTLLIDLASKPGGIDFELARTLGLRTIWALSLPGKTAPYRAGEIIYQTIANQLDEWGETL